MLSHHRILSAFIVVGLALFCRNALGQAEPKRVELVKTALDPSPLQPGVESTATVEVEVKPGFHAQSHTPSQENLIKFNIKLDDNPALTFGEPVYPKGEVYDAKALGILNVYVGKVAVHFPVQLKPGASPADGVIKGKVQVQVCDDNVCYPPVKLPFQIGGGGGAPTTAPTTAPAAAIDTGPAGAPPIILTGLYSSNALRSAIAAATEGKSIAASDEGPQYTVTVAFLFAFLAGLVFNVMPCVLPVLPLKAMGFYEASQHNRLRCIGYGLAFSLGVVGSFLVLGLLVVVKQIFKWGEIFSNPWFLGALVIILLLMAFFTFGFFQIRLPNAIYSVSPRHDTFFGNFLFGILTAALSTPCTFGMFVGLLTFALKQPPIVGLALMGTVGAGMASPYLVLSAFPEAARRFPRTGPWAELVKQVMGFLLLGMAAYFAEPFIERLLRPQAFWWMLFALVSAAGIFLVVRSMQISKTRVGPVVSAIIAVALIVPALLLTLRLTGRHYAWQPYTKEALADARASKQVVLVEFTADWCTTCHSLEALVLNDPNVVRDVNVYGVKMIRADLTDTDAPGWALLRKYATGQGVPLTAVYPKEG
jgi:thiol:disulfide interchange protein DsbD